MPQSKETKKETTNTSMFRNVIQSVGWPVFWGTAAYVGLLLAIKNQILTNEILVRYLTSHLVAYIATAMFCIGMAAIISRAIEVLFQMSSLNGIHLRQAEQEPKHALQVAEDFSSQLWAMPESRRSSYLWKRLHDAMGTIQRNESAESLEDELKYLADMDAARQQEGYSLVRILIWATPMLGFLGTVIGISDALGNIGVSSDGNFDTMMEGLSGALYVAFDTTALALTLAIIMMFGQFFVDRFETQLLDTVDRRATEQLMPSFAKFGHSSDPYLVSLSRMSESVLKSIESYQENQSKVWDETIQSTLATWNHGFRTNSTQVAQVVTDALTVAAERFSDRMGETMEAADTRMNERWKQWQVSLSENARVTNSHQSELSRQAELMEKAIAGCREMVGQVQATGKTNHQSVVQIQKAERALTSIAEALRSQMVLQEQQAERKKLEIEATKKLEAERKNREIEAMKKLEAEVKLRQQVEEQKKKLEAEMEAKQKLAHEVPTTAASTTAAPSHGPVSAKSTIKQMVVRPMRPISRRKGIASDQPNILPMKTSQPQSEMPDSQNPTTRKVA